MEIDFETFLISFKLAGLVTLILFVFSLPLAWHLSQSRSKLKPFIEAVTALPIVLPPTVLGFYILYALSYNSPVGAFFEENFGIKLVFNFTGLVIASCFYSLPLWFSRYSQVLNLFKDQCLKPLIFAGKVNLKHFLK